MHRSLARFLSVSLLLSAVTVSPSQKVAAATSVRQPSVLGAPLASSNNDLASLRVTHDFWDLDGLFFNPDQTYYTVVVPYALAWVEVEAVTADPGASLIVNGAPHSSWEYVSVNLPVGDTPIDIDIIAEDGSTKTYTVNVTRLAPSSNSRLSNLTLGAHKLTPMFDSYTTEYAVSIPADATSLEVTPVVDHAGATVTVNGAVAVSGNPVTTPVGVGTGSITVVVTAEDGSTTTYTITLDRAPSNEADLVDLTVGAGALQPGFAPDTLGYDLSVPYGTSDLTLTPTASTGSTLMLNGAPVANTSPTQVPISASGSTEVILVVTAADGVTTKTYRITVWPGPAFTTATANTSQSVRTGAGLAPLAVTAVADETLTFTLTGGALPAGITLNADGTFSGNATASGTFTATIQVVDAQGGSAITTLQIDVRTPPAPSAPVLPPPALSANGGIVTTPTPTITGATTLPDGSTVTVRIDDATYTATASQGRWSLPVASPLSVGQHSINVSGRRFDGQSALASAVLTVQVAPTITPVEDQTATEGDAVALQVQAAPGALGSRLTFAATNLPDGLQIDAATGLISGSPAKPGLYPITVTVTESVAGGTSQQTFAWLVLPLEPEPAEAQQHAAYISGYPDGTFEPERLVTRAEVATVLVRLVAPAPLAVPAARFTDLSPDHWAAEAITIASSRGLMVGNGRGEFRPNDQVSRAELAVIVSRLRELAPASDSFPDLADHWAAPFVASAKAAGLLSGYADGTFQPDRATTRAEFVTTINRTLGRGPLQAVQAATFGDVPTSHWAFSQIEEAATVHQFRLEADGQEYLLP